MGWKFQLRQDYSVRFNTVLQRNVLGLLLLNSVCCVHGNPQTICFNWDLVLQFLSPGHLNSSSLLKLDTWQSALPTKFQLNSFTFDCNACLCTRMKDQTRFFTFLCFPHLVVGHNSMFLYGKYRSLFSLYNFSK